MSGTLNKVFTLLNLLKPRDGINEWGATDLAKMTGYHLATTHRILQSMQNSGIVNQNPKTKKFFLGPLIVELGSLARSLFPIRDLARPIMEHLANETKESIYLNILLNQREALLIDSIDSIHRLRIVEPLGLCLPLHVAATRRVILAHMKMEEQEEYIRNCGWESRTPFTITNEADLRADLKKIRERGYAISYGETTIGTAGVAAPVMGVNGVEGSLGIATPETRLRKELTLQWGQLLMASSKKISASLGGDIW